MTLFRRRAFNRLSGRRSLLWRRGRRRRWRWSRRSRLRNDLDDFLAGEDLLDLSRRESLVFTKSFGELVRERKEDSVVESVFFYSIGYAVARC